MIHEIPDNSWFWLSVYCHNLLDDIVCHWHTCQMDSTQSTRPLISSISSCVHYTLGTWWWWGLSDQSSLKWISLLLHLAQTTANSNLCLYLCICMCICVCICACIGVCICMYICVWKQIWTVNTWYPAYCLYCLLWPLSISLSDSHSAQCLFVFLYLCVQLCLNLSDASVKSPISGPAYCLLWPPSASPSNGSERQSLTSASPMQLVEVEATTRPLPLNNHHHNQKVQTSTTNYQTYHILEIELATGDMLVSKQPDFLGLFNYLTVGGFLFWFFSLFVSGIPISCSILFTDFKTVFVFALGRFVQIVVVNIYQHWYFLNTILRV